MSLQIVRKAVVVQEDVTVTTSDGQTFTDVTEALRHEKAVQIANRFGSAITPETIVDNLDILAELHKWSGRGEPWGRKRGPRRRPSIDAATTLADVNAEMERELGGDDDTAENRPFELERVH